MAANLPLEKMSIEEKIQAMESLWDDLCKTADGIPPPPWHGNVLRERENAINEGTDEFIDWENAKKRIRNDIS